MNPRRILFIFVRLLAFAAVAETIAIWIFWRSLCTPIERHYLPAYIWCSLPIVSPSNVEVRLIWKTGRRRKRELATNDDAIDFIDGTGVELSRSAIEAGWKALIEGPPQQIPAEVLRPVLASLAFEGQSLWNFLLLPALTAMAALCLALCAWFLLVEFFRALLAELAWRRRLLACERPLPSYFETYAAVARKICSGLAALHGGTARRIEMQHAAWRTNVALIAPEVKPESFTLPIFGVHNRTGEDHLWSEKNEIL